MTAPTISIDKAQAVEFLQSIVGIPSVSGDESAVSQFIVQTLSQFGFQQAYVDDVGNAVGIRELPDSKGACPRTVVLLGHIDTVPGHIPVEIRDGRLFGRGSVDAKGSFAAFVIAAAGAHLPLGTRLVVIGAVEEEAATSKGARHAARSFSPSVCVIGEPSGWSGITLGYKGRLLVDYSSSQGESHSAGPETTPAEKLFTWWRAVTDRAAEINSGASRMFDQLLTSLRKIQTSSDGLRSCVVAQAGFRLPPDFDESSFCEFLKAAAPDAELEFRGYECAWSTPRHSDLVNALARAIRKSGGTPRYMHKTGTSDMNVVGPIWRCPIIAYGPGDSRLDHTPNEHLPIDEYWQSIGVLQRLLESPL